MLLRAGPIVLFLSLAALCGNANAQSGHPRPDDCIMGDPEACRSRGRDAEHARDFVGAANRFRWACGEGDAIACSDITHVADALATAELQRLHGDASTACASGDTSACWEAGIYSMHSWWVGSGPVGSAREWSALCEAGHAPACHSLSRVLEYSSTLSPDQPARALELVSGACEAGWIPACHELDMRAYADSYSDIQRGPLLESMSQWCDAGYRTACLDRWAILVRTNSGRGPSALQALRQECALGEARACSYVAAVDVATDASAMNVLTDVCSTGFVSGCLVLIAHARDVSTPASLDAVDEALSMACGAGHAPSCAERIELYDDPRRDTYDRDRAVEAAQAACEGGDVPSCFSWVRIVEPTQRSQEFEEMETLLTDLLTTRHPDAALELARFYETRELEVPNEALLAFVLDDACAAGSVDACSERGLELIALGRNVDAIPPLAVGCNGDDVEACLALGGTLMELGMAADAVSALEHACELGESSACSEVNAFFGYVQPITLEDERVRELVSPLIRRWEVNLEVSAAANPELRTEFFEEKQVLIDFEREGRVHLVVEDGPQRFEYVGVFRVFTLESSPDGSAWAALAMVFLDSTGGRFDLQYAFGFDGAGIDEGQLGLVPTRPGVGILWVPLVFDPIMSEGAQD